MKVSSSLCQRCRVLQFNDEEHGTVEERRSGEHHVYFNTFDPDCGTQAIILNYHLYDNLPDLPVMSASSASGCGMCFAMREKILQLERRADPKHKNVLIYKFCFCYKERWIFRRGSEFFNPSSHLAVHFKFIGDRNDDTISYTVSFHLQADIGDPCRSWLRIHGTPVFHPLSDKGRPQLRKLAKNSYKLSRDPHLPTRVIDVGYRLTRSKMRLVVNQGSHKRASRGKYLALSYCWGSEEDAADQLKTTKASLRENMKEIKIESLPKTVSDAVLICRAMRVRYLWVDALCIIQDSQDDWERESANMAEIYENSYFTLCALQGNSCQSGFLSDSHRHLIKVPFQSTLKPSISGSYYIYHVMGYHEEDYHKSLLEGHPQFPDSSDTLAFPYCKEPPFSCDVKESAWNTRGWTLQEAFCSPRLLLFGTRMVHLIALELRKSQDTTFESVCEPWGRNFSKDSGFQEQALHRWRVMIEGYTARHFSYSRDKLPAISSLARKFSTQIKGEYLAGIWSDGLSTDLLWTPHGLKTVESIFTPPKEYLAPSWSWASQCNPVRWPLLYDLKPECRIASIRTITGLDRYGKVQSGFITLQTKVFVIPSSAKMQRRRKASLGNNVEFPYELTSADGEYLAHLRFDWTDHTINDDNFLEAKQETAQLSMVLVSRNDCHPKYPGSHDFDGSWRFLGLLVLPTETSGSYRRAGIFLCGPRDLQGPKFWGGIDITTITLV